MSQVKQEWDGQYHAFNEALKYILLGRVDKKNLYKLHGLNLMMLLQMD